MLMIEVVEFGGMLHDIGILYTDAPEIGCFGDLPYIAHGLYRTGIAGKGRPSGDCTRYANGILGLVFPWMILKSMISPCRKGI